MNPIRISICGVIIHIDIFWPFLFSISQSQHSKPKIRHIMASNLRPSKPKKLVNVKKQDSDTDLVGIKSLTCPITGRLMKDPVMTIADGL